MPISRRTAVELLVAAAFFMENLDGTVIATALPQMADTFGVPPASLASGMTAYLLSLAVFIPASGWVAERFGGRRVFTVAILAFTLASVLCAASPGATAFTLARIAQGAAGALMVPVGRLVVLKGTEPRDLLRAIATLTWPALTAPVVGPPLGGFIADAASWRWIFLINVPVGLVCAVAALALIVDGPPEPRRPFDRVGFLLNGLALSLLLFALDRLGQPAESWGPALVWLAGSLALTGLAVRHARRHPHPLVSLDGFRLQSFRITMAGGSVSRIAISTMPFLLPLLFQVGLGRSSFEAGLYVLWYGATNLAIKPATTPILRRFGFRTVLLANTAISAASIAACACIDGDTPAPVVALLLMVAGASRSMQFTALNTLTFADVDAAGRAAANTLFNMAFQLAIGIGIAAGAIALRAMEAVWPVPPHAPLAAFQVTLVMAGVLALTPILEFFRLDRRAGAAVSGYGAGRIEDQRSGA